MASRTAALALMVGSLPIVALGACEQVHLALSGEGSSSYSIMWFNADDEVDYSQVRGSRSDEREPPRARMSGSGQPNHANNSS